MTQSTADRLAQVHADALNEFDEIQSAVREERMLALSDRRFYSVTGAQWEGDLAQQFENKPKFEVNKVHLAVIRIINEYRNNRITVEFTPKDGSTGDKLAETCNGLYRADEKDSVAEEAYDNAFEEAVGGGFGAWRLRACYEDDEDDENERQRVRMEPIHDADSTVFFNLDAKRQDKADAKRCYVLSSMTVGAYKEEYNDDPTSWPHEINQREFDWCSGDVVYVCELYKVEEKSELIHVFRGLDDVDMMVPAAELEADEDKRTVLEATGFREVRQKRIKRRKVHKYLLSGGKVLKDEGYIAGKCIPIIPTYGKRWFVDNVERFMGHVRLAKDTQRLKNMQVSKLGEISALSSVEKPIVTPEQMAGHTIMWSEDNIKNYPYMLLNPMRDDAGNVQAAGPLAYTRVPNIPPAMAALLQITEQDMQDLLGNAQAGEQLQPNQSGRAVELIQQRLDMQVFIYMSNQAKAMKRSGEVWLSMSKELVIEENRRMKSVDGQNKVSSVVMNEPGYDAETGEETIENNLSEATFDVYADVGPSSGSRRAATVRALTGMMTITQDPTDLSVLSAMAMMNMEGEGLSETRDYYRQKLVKAGVVKPTDEEMQQLMAEKANQPPDANTVFLMKSAEAAEAKAGKDRAGTVETIASADLKRAQTAKTMAETMGATQSQQIAEASALRDLLAPPTPAETSPIQAQPPTNFGNQQ
jgi:Phage P22-like portal protein